MKILVIPTPIITVIRPPAGSAIVCAICKNLGHDVSALDINIKFKHYCSNKNLDHKNYESIFAKFKDPTVEESQILDEFINPYLDEISIANYDLILISVFSTDSRFFTEFLCRKLREGFKGKIAAGGIGIDNTEVLSDEDSKFGTQLKKQGLIDDFISGEAEISLVNYLTVGKGSGVNEYITEQVGDLNSLPFPDYSFFNIKDYELVNDKPNFYITGSRGCVRKCTYCNVAKYWPKYRYRSGENIAQEIIHNYENFGVTDYYFTDSLVNGNQKNFIQMCEILANYPFANKLNWGGQFIFLPKKSLHDEWFEIIAKAGGNEFYVGLECGSDKIRKEMGKNFTNEDVDYQLEMFKRNNLHVMFLMFAGYITETLEDHQATIDIFPRWQHYVASGTITGIDLGMPLLVLADTPLEHMIDDLHLTFVQGEHSSLLWHSDLNPTLDFKERIRRRIEINEEAIKYTWPVWRARQRLTDIKNIVIKNRLHLEQPKYQKIIPIGLSDNKKDSTVLS